MRQLLCDFKRTRNFVASSAAALVSEAVYKSTPTNKSTAFHAENQKNKQPAVSTAEFRNKAAEQAAKSGNNSPPAQAAAQREHQVGYKRIDGLQGQRIQWFKLWLRAAHAEPLLAAHARTRGLK